MVHDLNPKNLHINGLYFSKSKKLYFGSVLGYYPQNEIFSKNPASPVFTLKAP